MLQAVVTAGRWRVRQGRAPERRIVLCGLNELGLRTLEELHRLGEAVVVIARAPAAELAAGARRLGATLIEGNYRDESVQRAAGVPSAAAFVVVEDDDIGNMHAALTAYDLNPGLRICLRTFNPELGRQIERLFPDCRVLDAATLAVPAFVSAALHEDWQQQVEVAGRTLAVVRAPATDPRVLLPLARTGEEGAVEVFPPSGDGLLCLATDDSHPARHAAPSRHRARRRVPFAPAWQVLARDRRLRWLVGILVALSLATAAIFSTFADLSLVDALYYTVVIITTTGFGDLQLSSDALRLYSVALMLIGTAALTSVFALITDGIVSARLEALETVIPRDIRDHVVVCGVGNIGYRIVEQLVKLGVPVVATEREEANRFVPSVRQLGVPLIIGDMQALETLQALRVDRARCLVAASSSDAVNLGTALNARTLNPNLRVVLRLFHPDFAARVERSFRIDVSRSPSALAAPAFAAAALGEQVDAIIPAGTRVLLVARIRVEPGSLADGSTVAGAVAGLDARVFAVLTGGAPRWRPAPNTLLAAGDELALVATRAGLAGVLARTEAAPAGHLPDGAG